MNTTLLPSMRKKDDMIFKDRLEAGQKLASVIKRKYPKIENGIILALPRGGVVVAHEVAKALNLPLDIIVTRKIGHPFNPEYAVAAVGKNSLVLNPNESIDKNYLGNEAEKERQEIQRRLNEYRPEIPYPILKDKIVFLVDDGLATGLTMEAAIEEVKINKSQKIILAVPVAPNETIKKMQKLADEVFCLLKPEIFFAIGQFYQNFEQTTDEEVKSLLR